MKIQDTILDPYSIEKVTMSYDIIEDTGKVNIKGEKVTRTHGHFSNTESALLKICKLKLDEVDITYSLKEYVATLREIKDEIKSL